MGPCSLTITRSTSSSFRRQYSWARNSCRTMSMSSISSMRTRTIGRSPEIPYGHRPGRAAFVASQHVGRRPQRGVGIEDPVGEALEEVRLVGRRCRGDGAAPAPGSRPGSRPARTWPARGTCRRGRAPRHATRRRPSRRSRARWRPGRSETRQRRLKIGSSTAPTVFDSGRPSITEIGRPDRTTTAEEAGSIGFVLDQAAAHPLRRPRRARPRSALRRSTSVDAWPAARRVSGRTRSARRGSEKAGWAMSAACGGERDLGVRGQFDLARAVTRGWSARPGGSRRRAPPRRRSSRVVVIDPSRREISAWSSE